MYTINEIFFVWVLNIFLDIILLKCVNPKIAYVCHPLRKCQDGGGEAFVNFQGTNTLLAVGGPDFF